jgi:SAM-dependent methyltransferase
MLIVRHVLEHAHNPAAFLRGLKQILRPEGYLVVEVPDCTKFVRACDYSFVWEEHIVYFCARTLAAFLSEAGFALQEIIRYPYPLEDSLIAVARNEDRVGEQWPTRGELQEMLAAGRFFADSFFGLKERMHRLFRRWRSAGKRVAVFGAGHLAIKFVNFFALADFLECVLDDNPHKQQLLIPGSRLRISGSEALYSRPVDYCLLSLNPESEQKVLARHRSFLERGGRFFSIFALSPQSVYRVLAT